MGQQGLKPGQFTMPLEALDQLPEVQSGSNAGAQQMRADQAAGESHGIIADAPGNIMDGLLGALKGVGDTSTSLINMVPGAEGVTNYLGNKAGEGISRLLYGKEAVSPPVSKDAVENAFEPTSTAQALGKGAEQIGEFFIPAGMARQAAVKGLVTLIPDAASPGMMKVLNKVGAVIGRTVGEAGSAAAVGKLQGQENVDETAMIAGAAPLLASGAQAALGNKKLQEIIALYAATAPQALVPSGLAPKMGSFSLVKKELEKVLGGPRVQGNVRRVVNGATRGTAAIRSYFDDNE